MKDQGSTIIGIGLSIGPRHEQEVLSAAMSIHPFAWSTAFKPIARLIDSVGKVHHDDILNQMANTRSKGLVTWVRVGIIVPIFTGSEFHYKAMGEAILETCQ